ncbi:hypothetical protein DW029_00945 [Collinsella sp. AF38-3AC]|nr:hypothetical protein DW029_00945 [Collinsella sp. AF38-3AC]
MKACRHLLERAGGKRTLDIAEHPCHERGRAPRLIAPRRRAAHELALVAIHELGQQELKQAQNDLGAVEARLVVFAEHLLHVASHAPTLPAAKAHVPAMVGLAVERVEQKPRYRALAREARLEAALQKGT